MSEEKKAQLIGNRRLSAIIARTVMFHDGGTYDAEITAKMFGASEFEARLIGLAYYWSNDLLDLALETLSIEIPEHLAAPRLSVMEDRNEWVKRRLAELPDCSSPLPPLNNVTRLDIGGRREEE